MTRFATHAFARLAPKSPFAVLLPLLALLASPGGAEAQLSSCAGVADYSAEMALFGFSVENETSVGGGLVDIEVSAQVTNQDVGEFEWVRPEYDFSNLPYGVDPTTPVVPMQFQDVQPLSTVPAAFYMQMRLPSGNVDALIAALEAGEIPLIVRGDERLVMAEGVTLRIWGKNDDDNFDPDAGVFRFPLGQAPGVLAGYQPGDTWYILEDKTRYELENAPSEFASGRVIAVTSIDGDDESIWSYALDPVIEDDVLTDLVESGSFCTTDAHHIDWPVEESRVGETVPTATESRTVPIRFNGVDFFEGSIMVSGQMKGHLIKPKLQIRFREGEVYVNAGIESNVSFTGQIKAEGEVDFPPEEHTLWELCFALPDIVIGPVTIPLSLELEHILGTQANLKAGAVVAVQKSFKGGWHLEFDGRLPEGQRFSAESFQDKTPIEFTPPYLTDDTHAFGKVWTNLRTALKVGSKAPECDIPFVGELFAQVTAAGQLDVDPQWDPWWQMRHSASATLGFGLEPLGINIVHREVTHDFGLGDEILIPEVEEEEEEGGDGEEAAARAVAAGAVTPRRSGVDQRWAVSFDESTAINDVAQTRATELADQSVLLITRGNQGTQNELMKLDRYGALEWNERYRVGREPQDVVAMPDGGFMVVGDTLWLARHDADGNLLWNNEIDFSDPEGAFFDTCRPKAITSAIDGDGRTGALVAGIILRPPNSDACIVRVDADGNVLWTRIFEGERNQVINDVTTTSDGGFALAGSTIFGPAIANNNSLAIKLDGAGNMEWAKTFPTIVRAGTFHAVAESGGLLYFAGSHGLIVNRDGSFAVARMELDGSDVRHALYIQDVAWEAELDFEQWTPTDGGDTAWDEALGLAPAPGGVVAVGHTGLPFDPNPARESAAWALKVNGSLGVEWFSTFDGARSEFLDHVAPAKYGFLASGISRSTLPLGVGGTESAAFLMKLPFEGIVDFLPATNLTARFIESGTYYASSDPDVVPDGQVSLDQPFDPRSGSIDGTGPIADLMVDGGAICVTKLTRSGKISTNDACDDDTDGDGTPDSSDGCPGDPAKIEPGICGCGFSDDDSDQDSVIDCQDQCPTDPLKSEQGQCGCFVAETDSDADQTPDCIDLCPSDPDKVDPGQCGCFALDVDTDSDGTANCNDECPGDPNKIVAGECGCGVAEGDLDGDGSSDCVDLCPFDPFKSVPGVCDCGVPDTDTDQDGTADCIDGCAADPTKTEPGLCGCGQDDEADADQDGTPDCIDLCGIDPYKTEPGICGCNVADDDDDGDGTLNCFEECPNDPDKVEEGECGCGVPESPGCVIEALMVPTWDTFILQGRPNHNEGGNERLRVRNENVRSLLRFDQVAMRALVDDGTLLSATLELTIADRARRFGRGGTRSVDIHQMTSWQWLEGSGAVWRTRPRRQSSGPGATWECSIDDLTQNRVRNCRSTMPWEMGRGDLGEPNPWAAEPTDSVVLTDKQRGKIRFDVTKDILQWIEGGPNYGWVLKIGSTKNLFHGDVSFWSKDESQPTEKRPLLILEIQPAPE